MNRRIVVAQVSVLFFVCAILLSFHTAASANPNTICGTISANTTWTTAGSPYEVCASGLTISQGATLTVDPGVKVTFDNGGVSNTLYVQGALVAVGTPTQPITLTAVVATPGSWGGISTDNVANPAHVTLDNVAMEYGGINGSYGAQVYADHAVISVHHSRLRDGAGNGIYTTISTQFDVQSTSFTNNGRNALQINSPIGDLTMSGLSATGNGTNAAHVIGPMTLHGQRRWTNPGIPYVVDGGIGNSPGDALTIEAGAVMQFGPAGALNIGGQLLAQGTSSQPILMTGVSQSPGAWIGISGNGGNSQAVVQLDYTTVEYAGADINGANIEMANGRLNVHHSIIRNSSKDGVKFDTNTGGSILNSQIYGNTANGYYGIRNGQPNRAVLATNDWWGDPGGPRSDITGCSSGNGDRVTAGVLFVPVLTSANTSVTIPLSNSPNLTLTPERWFAPANGATRIYFDITLRDGNGAALPGRTAKLHTTFGNIVDGGTTDALGKTRGWLTSSSAGDALVNATLDGLTACEGALSPESRVTFTTPVSTVDLMPDSPAPYANGNISVSPLPVVTGVNTTITARLTNPLTTTVTTDVEFDFVQSSIGLAFGKIGSINGVVIQPNSTILLSTSFTPSVSGHYCVQVAYDITAIGASPVQPGQTRQLKPFNMNVQQSTTSNNDKNNSLDKTRNSLKQVNRFVNRAYDTKPIALPLAVANAGIEWDLNNAEKISNALNGDPPRQDYTLIDTPKVLELPPTQPGGGISVARANALNALDDALAKANAYGTASATAFDRSGGATAAGDLSWASIQTGVMLEDNQLMGTELITATLKIDNLIAVAASEGDTSAIQTVDDVVAMQQDLATNGFTPQEISDAHTVGLTDADLASIKASILASDPNDLAGDVIANMQAIRQQLYNLALVLINPTMFAPGITVTGGMPVAAKVNTMAQPYNTTTTFILANPNSSQATINLSVRRIDLPEDWNVVVTPAQATLNPGQQTTVTVTIIAGAPLAQGSLPQMAVEGYIGSQLLGGVVVQVMVPVYWPYDGKLRLYLPVMRR
jgi:hypothetical protein